MSIVTDNNNFIEIEVRDDTRLNIVLAMNVSWWPSLLLTYRAWLSLYLLRTKGITLPSTSSVWGVDSSLRSTLLGGNNLKFLLACIVSAEGMFIRCPIAEWGSSLEEIGRLRWISRTLQIELIGSRIALGMGVGLGLISNFKRNSSL